MSRRLFIMYTKKKKKVILMIHKDELGMYNKNDEI